LNKYTARSILDQLELDVIALEKLDDDDEEVQ